MKAKTMELTIVPQCTDLYDLPDTLAKAKVKVEWLTSVDIAVNREAVKGIVEGYRAALKPPPKVEEYQKAINNARATLKGEELENEFRKLNRKFGKVMEDETARVRKIEEEAQKEVRKVKIVPIKVTSIKGEHEVMSLIASALLPVLDFDSKDDKDVK